MNTTMSMIVTHLEWELTQTVTVGLSLNHHAVYKCCLYGGRRSHLDSMVLGCGNAYTLVHHSMGPRVHILRAFLFEQSNPTNA